MSCNLARCLVSLSLVLLASACEDDVAAAGLATGPRSDGATSAGSEASAPEASDDAAAEADAPSPARAAPTAGISPPPDRAADADLAKLAAGNRAFAFDLFRSVASTRAGEDVVLAPYGVSSALAMVFAGARRLTEAELGATLHFDVPPPALHASFAEVSRQLAARGRADGALALTLGSNVWVQRDLPIVPEFDALLRASYGAPPEPADFATDPAGARAAINARVAERTGGKIADLLRADEVGAETDLVLTSTASLSARWKTPFGAAVPAPFTTASGATANVPSMRATGTFPRARGENWEAVALPYAGDALRFIAVLPDAGAYEAVESEASAGWFDEVRAALRDAPTTVSLPKWQARTRTPLRGALEALDLRSLFRGGDLTGITDEGVALDDVIHEALIEVHEDGVQAAGESGAGAGTTDDATAVQFDRPFLYAIVDEPTGQILFLGRVLAPRGE